MKPNDMFLRLPKTFWAGVRLISQEVGYTDKITRQIKIPSVDQINIKMQECGIDFHKWRNRRSGSNRFGILLDEYFRYRAEVLYTFVEPRLMDSIRAKQTFETLHKKLKPSRQVPMNKQSGEKKSPAYLTGLVNMIVEAYSQGLPCDYDPQQLTLITRDGLPVRTLARRVDGAFPSSTNPVAVWEIKEYYYTTTFGSRVADGIYESLLDGLELEELRENENIDVKHCLMIDAHDTWWTLGKSYLCRVIDMLHMGYLDEVLFGYEVVERLPSLVSEWVQIAKGK